MDGTSFYMDVQSIHGQGVSSRAWWATHRC